jgi:hypothetical protein
MRRAREQSRPLAECYETVEGTVQVSEVSSNYSVRHGPEQLAQPNEPDFYTNTILLKDASKPLQFLVLQGAPAFIPSGSRIRARVYTGVAFDDLGEPCPEEKATYFVPRPLSTTEITDHVSVLRADGTVAKEYYARPISRVD